MPDHGNTTRVPPVVELFAKTDVYTAVPTPTYNYSSNQPHGAQGSIVNLNAGAAPTSPPTPPFRIRRSGQWVVPS